MLSWRSQQHFDSIQRQGDEKTTYLNSDWSTFQAKLKVQVLLSNQLLPINIQVQLQVALVPNLTRLFQVQIFKQHRAQRRPKPTGIFYLAPVMLACVGSSSALAMLWSASRQGHFNTLGASLWSKLLPSTHKSSYLPVREMLGNSYW